MLTPKQKWTALYMTIPPKKVPETEVKTEVTEIVVNEASNMEPPEVDSCKCHDPIIKQGHCKKCGRQVKT